MAHLITKGRQRRHTPRCSATIRSARSVTKGSIFFGVQPSDSIFKEEAGAQSLFSLLSAEIGAVIRLRR